MSNWLTSSFDWLPRPWSTRRPPIGPGASMVTDTTETVRRAARGDAAAFALLCHSRAPAVVAYIGAICPDAAERDQLARRVFVRAWRELPSLDKPRRFDLWLLRLTHTEVGAPETRPANGSARLAPSSYVASELFTLPSTLRETLSLRYFFGRAVEEIAPAFDQPVDVVDGWLEAGLQALGSAVAPAAMPASLAA